LKAAQSACFTHGPGAPLLLLLLLDVVPLDDVEVDVDVELLELALPPPMLVSPPTPPFDGSTETPVAHATNPPTTAPKSPICPIFIDRSSSARDCVERTPRRQFAWKTPRSQLGSPFSPVVSPQR
jgi:hypothetical protein